jgi:hypothetical protein
LTRNEPGPVYALPAAGATGSAHTGADDTAARATRDAPAAGFVSRTLADVAAGQEVAVALKGAGSAGAVPKCGLTAVTFLTADACFGVGAGCTAGELGGAPNAAPAAATSTDTLVTTASGACQTRTRKAKGPRFIGTPRVVARPAHAQGPAGGT